jgi:hypothetical protein
MVRNDPEGDHHDGWHAGVANGSVRVIRDLERLALGGLSRFEGVVNQMRRRGGEQGDKQPGGGEGQYRLAKAPREACADDPSREDGEDE